MTQRYTPDFPEMMRLNETNYAQLRRLLPREEREGESITYQINSARYRLTIEESTRYTTRINLCQTAPAVSYWSLSGFIMMHVLRKCVQHNRSIVLKRAMIIRITNCISVMKNIRLISSWPNGSVTACCKVRWPKRCVNPGPFPDNRVLTKDISWIVC